MAKKKLTVFQRLDAMISGRQKTKPKVNLDGKVFTTKSRDEYETKKTQAQQDYYLQSMWQKVDNEMYQQAIFYEVTRIASYSDFEAMEFYPEIAAALDIMMEEATTVNKEGDVLNIYSESKRVRRALKDLFNKRLDIHTNLPMWVRNTCKYGDNFLMLNVSDTDGIVGVRQLPNIDIERREGDMDNIMAGYGNIRPNPNPEDTSYSDDVKFIWKSKEYEFTSWQIAHFRLLGDDRKMPYGTSILEKARRIWKQLVLSEDAMLIYRVTRAPERRIYKIFVGNIDDADVEAYVNKIANRFKRTPLIDPATGQIDLRFNQLAQDQDYFIPVRDPNTPNPIDTLPGAANLSEIADIEYLQKKLFAAIRVPKPFLGFEEVTGEGKNLALQDIRFARTVNRIQQAMLQELNKIAIIHLYLLGMEEDLDNFTLTLNNPSTQADMLQMEHLQMKIQAYKEAVVDAGNGFGAMSMTRAKKEIMGMSDDEILHDLQQQRLEKAAAAEMEQTPQIIRKTGIFDDLDKMYGEIGVEPDAQPQGEEGMGAEGGFGGGGFGGGGFGAEGGGDFGAEPSMEGGLEGGGGIETPPPLEGVETAPPEAAVESIDKGTDKLILENKTKKIIRPKSKSKFDELLETLTESEKDDVNIEPDKSLNENIESITKSIDDLLKE